MPEESSAHASGRGVCENEDVGIDGGVAIE